MVQKPPIKRMAIKLSVMIGVWGTIILLISLTTLLSSLQENMPISMTEAIIFEFWCISPWIILTPFIMKLAQTYRFERPELFISIGLHLLAAATIFVLHCLVQSYMVSLQFDIPFGWAYLKRDFLGFIDMRVMLYSGILLVVYSLDFYRKNKEIKLRAPRLKKELNKAKFHAILNKVQPAFLLNSIESIKESLDTSKEEAEDILTNFSDLLRIMLANVERENITIQEDMDSYFLYTSLLQKRLHQNIIIKSDIDQECYNDLIPPFLVLIPLLEEVVDIMKKTDGKLAEIHYKAQRIRDRIELEATIKGEHILSGNLSELLQKTRIAEVVNELRKEYGETIDFIPQGNSNEIQVALTLPLKEGSDNYEVII